MNAIYRLADVLIDGLRALAYRMRWSFRRPPEDRAGKALALDPTFGDGRSGMLLLASSSVVKALSVEPGSGFMLVGYETLLPDNGDLLEAFGVARLSADGVRDSGFGDGGQAAGIFADYRGAVVVTGVHPHRDLSVVLSAHLPGLGPGVGLVSFDNEGEPVEKFGIGGAITHDFRQTISAPDKIAERSPGARTTGSDDDHGRTVVSVLYDSGSGHRAYSVIARLDEFGDRDVLFNGTGIAIVEHPQHPDGRTRLHGVTVQPDGKYLGYGDLIDDQGFFHGLLVRLYPDGSWDVGFGDNGYLLIDSSPLNPLNQLTFSAATSFVAGAGELRIIAAGTGNSLSLDHGVVGCFKANGVEDGDFNDGELAILAPADQSVRFQAVVVSPGGGIVVGGISNFPSIRMLVARYQRNGQLDPGFNAGSGWGYVPMDGLSVLESLIVQEDEKVVVGGSYAFGGVVARLV